MRPCNRNDYILNLLRSINWRASLVPAAAVIPAPIAYIKAVAVKKLVVGSVLCTAGPRSAVRLAGLWSVLPVGGLAGGGFQVRLRPRCLSRPSGDAAARAV